MILERKTLCSSENSQPHGRRDMGAFAPQILKVCLWGSWKDFGCPIRSNWFPFGSFPRDFGKSKNPTPHASEYLPMWSESAGEGSGFGGKTRQTLPFPSQASSSNIFQRNPNWGRWFSFDRPKFFFVKPILVLDHFYRLYLVAGILALIDTGYSFIVVV